MYFFPIFGALSVVRFWFWIENTYLHNSKADYILRKWNVEIDINLFASKLQIHDELQKKICEIRFKPHKFPIKLGTTYQEIAS